MSRYRIHGTRIVTSWLVAGQVVLGLPIAPPSSVSAVVEKAVPLPEPRVTVNRSAPKVAAPNPHPKFSQLPTIDEIFQARIFGEPLLPVGGTPSDAQNAALASAIVGFHTRGGGDGSAAFARFLERYPESPWRASLLANLGAVYVRTHVYTRAFEALETAWSLAKDATDLRGKAVADFALAEWAELAVSFGQIARVEERLAAIAGRPMSGAAGVKIARVRETAALIKRFPERTRWCGPEALMAIFAARNNGVPVPRALTEYPGTDGGMSLSELQALAQRSGLGLRPARRDAAGSLPTGSVMHLKVGHYVAIVGRNGDQYRIVDRARGTDYWMPRDHLIEEASGYFLVPENAPTDGWESLTDEERHSIRGSGPICPDGSPNPSPPPPPQKDPCLRGMATYSFQAVSASLLIHDTPAGYSPPRGPEVPFTVSYHHREALQPQIFTSANLGPKWTFDWLRFVQEVPMGATGTMSAHVWVALPPGGREVFAFPNAQGEYPAHWHSRATLVRVSASPLRYERRLPDGTVEVYAYADGAPTGLQRVFLTQLIDPRGQGLEFTWDGQFRLVAITDALNQVSTIEYNLGGDPLKITAIVDPFGRRATFTYNAAGQLETITDVIGLVSRFAYSTNDFVSTLTTPYGVTSFRHEQNALNTLNFRFIEATDPLGGTEHLEFQYQTPSMAATAPANEVPTGFAAWNTNLNQFNTFYWDARAWGLYPADVTKSIITHWLVAEEWQGWQKWSALPHSVKRPLEGREWYAYPGQTTGTEGEVGWWREPSRVARVLDGGASQVFEVTYNLQGSPLSRTDPLGRQTSYVYGANGVDLIEVRQTTTGTNHLLATFGNFTSLHQPQTVTDATAQTTTVGYNTAGQVLTVTNPRQEMTTYGYTGAYLTTITGAMAGAVTTIGYDAFGRPRTVTGSDSYSVTIDYDVFDRLTRITYPDGTYDERTYQRLDLATTRDRLGRVTRYYYDALRRLTAIRDPLGRTVTQEWCGCGSLEALVDGKGNRTRWERDLQGRVTKEVRANGSETAYAYATTTSRLTQRTDGKNQQTNYQYFLDGALQQLSYANATITTPTVSLTYDTAYGRLATMTDGIGTTTYTYHPVAVLGAGRVASVDGPLSNDTITYAYDQLGRVVSRTLNGTTATWAYDALGRLGSQGDPIGTFTYAYAGTTSRLQQLTYPNGQTSTYTYLPTSGDRRLQEIHHRTAGGATLSRFSYAYDIVGNITTWTQQYESTIRAYDLRYDVADQLIAATYRTTDPTPVVLSRYGYRYDSVANRTGDQLNDAASTATYDVMNRLTALVGGGLLSFEGTVSEPATVTLQGTPASVDAANRFTGVAAVSSGTTVVNVAATDASGNSRTQAYEVDAVGSIRTLTHDANGNVTTDGTRTYEWDAADRLVRVLDGGAESARFVYDAFGRRVQKIVAGVGRTFVYDAEDILEERLPTATLRHVHGPGIDTPLATLDGTGMVSYYLGDHLGNVVQRTTGSGQITLTRQYDPFGKPLQGGTVGGYAFTGREWDQEVGLYCYRARYFDPILGRFLSADSAGFVDGPNLYVYGLNSPIVHTDPSGHNVLTGVWTGAGIGSAAGPAGTVIGGLVGGLAGLLVGQLLWDNVVRPLLTNDETQENAKRNTPDQEAVIDLAKEAKNKGGLTETEAEALLDLAKGAGVRVRGPEQHPDRPFGKIPHIHVGPVDHIPVCKVK